MGTVIEKRNLLDEIQEAFEQRGQQNNANSKKAFELFLKSGLPGPKTEEYKFTPITRILEKALDLNAASIQGPPVPSLTHFIPELICNVVAFINGQFSTSHSVLLDKGLEVKVLKQEGANGTDPFDLLNQAFNSDVIQITVKPGKPIQHPVLIVYHFDSAGFVFANPRWRCQIDRNCELSLIEMVTSQGATTYFNNKQSVVQVGENSVLEYVSIQNGPRQDIQLNNSLIHLSTASKASCFTFTFDGQLVRNNLTLTIDGPGVDAHLFGLYLLSANNIVDNHTVVDHRQPNSYSNELYKGVMDGNSKGVFNGKIYVRPQAQKTNAFQSNRNILLGDSASVNTKPQLEIWADDVKCSHGCTTGQLDEEALFYLRSRGISNEDAKGMLLYAFATETTETLKNENIRSFVNNLISRSLNKSY